MPSFGAEPILVEPAGCDGQVPAAGATTTTSTTRTASAPAPAATAGWPWPADRQRTSGPFGAGGRPLGDRARRGGPGGVDDDPGRRVTTAAPDRSGERRPCRAERGVMRSRTATRAAPPFPSGQHSGDVLHGILGYDGERITNLVLAGQSAQPPGHRPASGFPQADRYQSFHNGRRIRSIGQVGDRFGQHRTQMERATVKLNRTCRLSPSRNCW